MWWWFFKPTKGSSVKVHLQFSFLMGSGKLVTLATGEFSL